MKVTIEVSKRELEEMKVSEKDLKWLAIGLLDCDSSRTEMAPFNVYVDVIESDNLQAKT